MFLLFAQVISLERVICTSAHFLLLFSANYCDMSWLELGEEESCGFLRSWVEHEYNRPLFGSLISFFSQLNHATGVLAQVKARISNGYFQGRQVFTLWKISGTNLPYTIWPCALLSLMILIHFYNSVVSKCAFWGSRVGVGLLMVIYTKNKKSLSQLQLWLFLCSLNVIVFRNDTDSLFYTLCLVNRNLDKSFAMSLALHID